MGARGLDVMRFKVQGPHEKSLVREIARVTDLLLDSGPSAGMTEKFESRCERETRHKTGG